MYSSMHIVSHMPIVHQTGTWQQRLGRNNAHDCSVATVALSAPSREDVRQPTSTMARLSMVVRTLAALSNCCRPTAAALERSTTKNLLTRHAFPAKLVRKRTEFGANGWGERHSSPLGHMQQLGRVRAPSETT